MAILSPVLYGRRLYGRTLYSSNPDPQALTLTLSDSVGTVDTLADTISLSALLETITVSDALLSVFTKGILDAVTLNDFLTAFYISRSFSEIISVSDLTFAKTAIVAMQDVLLLQDWVSIQLFKPTIWTVHPAIAPSVSTLYGRCLYGRALYSSNRSVRWVDTKPDVTNNGWKSYNKLMEP